MPFSESVETKIDKTTATAQGLFAKYLTTADPELLVRLDDYGAVVVHTDGHYLLESRSRLPNAPWGEVLEIGDNSLEDRL